MYPFERITSPEPTPPPLPLWAMIVTTVGSCCSATEVTLHAAPVDASPLGAAVVVIVVDLFEITRITTTAAASTTTAPINSARKRCELGRSIAIKPFWTPRPSSPLAAASREQPADHGTDQTAPDNHGNVGGRDDP